MNFYFLSKYKQLSQVVDLDTIKLELLEILNNKDLELLHKKSFIHWLGGMFLLESAPRLDFISYILTQYKDYDKYDFQIEIGQVLAKLIQEDKQEFLARFESGSLDKASTVVGRRVNMVYLAQCILRMSEVDLSDRILRLQAVFFKYIFDKKDELQDIAQTVLNKLYTLGDQETKQTLVA